MNDVVLITIGNPKGEIPILPLVATFVEETPAKSAKRLRKQVAANPEGYGYAKGTHFSPAELYWACYHDSSDEKPFLASDNFFCKEALLQEAHEKAAADLLNRLGKRAIRMVELQIHEGKCPACGCFSLVDGHCQACDVIICTECFSPLNENLECSYCGQGK